MTLADMIVIVAVAAAFAAIIVKKVKDKKAGKSGCGCGCSGCVRSDSACSSSMSDHACRQDTALH